MTKTLKAADEIIEAVIFDGKFPDRDRERKAAATIIQRLLNESEWHANEWKEECGKRDVVIDRLRQQLAEATKPDNEKQAYPHPYENMLDANDSAGEAVIDEAEATEENDA